MDSENPTLKWSLAAVGVVVVCFCLGYFVFGSKGGSASETVSAASPTPVPLASLPVTVVENPGLQVEDITAEKDAERKRLEEVEKAKQAAKLKAEEAKLVEPSPDPEPTPETESTPEPEPTPVAEEPKPAAGEETKPETEKPKPAAGEETKPETEKPKPAGEGAASKSLYRVRVGGAKSSREEAEKLVAELRGRGYTPTIIADQRKGKTIFHVQTGAFSDADGAERRKKELESNGYDVNVH